MKNMYDSNQFLKISNKCGFPFDGIGRLYPLREEEKPQWEKVVEHFSALGKDVKLHYDPKTCRYLCKRYPHHREDCNEKCPGYRSKSGVSSKKTIE